MPSSKHPHSSLQWMEECIKFKEQADRAIQTQTDKEHFTHRLTKIHTTPILTYGEKFNSYRADAKY
jgi:hypothetical protein